jgi:hypothetical protein
MLQRISRRNERGSGWSASYFWEAGFPPPGFAHVTAANPKQEHWAHRE